MKLKNVKFANAIKIGGDEMAYVDERYHTIEVTKEPYLRVMNNARGTEWTYTTFYNVISFTPVSPEALSVEADKPKLVSKK